jgi:dCTP deaminase
MILTKQGILNAMSVGVIEIDPFDPEHLNPASYDLRLGGKVLQYVIHNETPEESLERHNLGLGKTPFLDAKLEPEVRSSFIDRKGILLKPGEGYLMHTVERVKTQAFVPVLDGKSSIGRLFVSVHQTAGYGDPGFDGQYTLEVTTLYPVRLYAGMRIAQMRFHAVSGEVTQYAGNYTGEAARGPVASRAWKQWQR